jgi:zinc and cadmium transporter
MAVGAGILVGAAFLDLLPEAVTLGALANITVQQELEVTLASFLAFFLLDVMPDLFIPRDAQDDGHRLAGRFAAIMLILHSFRDGMAIGASYQASPMAGYTVALGIGAHDFGDGLNTVLLTTRGNKPKRADYVFLIADALAPIAGGITAVRYFSSAKESVFLLAAAAGFFIEMAASDLLPELKSYATSKRWTVPSVLAGAGLIYMANVLVRAMK